MSGPNVTVLTVVPLDEEKLKRDGSLVPILEKSLMLVHELLELADSLKTAIETKYAPALEQMRAAKKLTSSDDFKKGLTVSSGAQQQSSMTQGCSPTCQLGTSNLFI